MHIRKNILYRVYASFLVMVVFGAAIIGRGYRIQTMDNGHWAALADSLSTDLVSIPAERGNIYSADGRLIATSMPYFDIRMDLDTEAMTDEIFNSNVSALARQMAKHWPERSYSYYKKDLIEARHRGSRYHLIKRHVDYAELNMIKQWPLFELGKYKGGLITEMQQERLKPYNEIAARTIGMKRENAQSVGLEAQFDAYLSGQEGRRLMQRIAGGNWIPLTDENAVDPKNGKDLYTTIDINLQDVAQASLVRAMAKHNAVHGCVVVMEVETGAIRAIANLGLQNDGTYAEIYNYAIGKRTEPGSTFKVASFLAMLEDGHITPDDSVDVHNGHKVFYRRHMYDAGNWNKYRVIPAWKVLSISSNVGTATFADRAYQHDKEGFYKRLKQYHLTEKTGIGIPGEPEPFIKDPRDKENQYWSMLSAPWMSIGYEVQLTPLQILTFYNAIANGGKMVRPRLAEKIMDHGKVVHRFPAEVVDKQISTPEAIAQITDMMINVVEEGTARKIRSDHYKIAGKTGTAALPDPEKPGYTNKYQASFAGFYPADAPKYSCIVVIQSPSKGWEHGGDVAAPVFKEIADRIMSVDLDLQEPYNLADAPGNDTAWVMPFGDFTSCITDYRRLARELGLPDDDQPEAEFISLRKGENGEMVISAVEVEVNKVPDVNGMSLDDAIYHLENAGLKVRFEGTGKVVRQSIRAGTKIEESKTISLTLG